MTKRIFISFAIEDETYRDFLVGQARNEDSPLNSSICLSKNPGQIIGKPGVVQR